VNARIDRAWLLSHLPHAGQMNLLDEVVSWDATSLHARANRHRDAAIFIRHAGIFGYDLDGNVEIS